MMAMSDPGIFREIFGQNIIIRRASIPIIRLERSSVVRFWPYAVHLLIKSAGTCGMFSPRKSLTWLEKIMTAMPLVKPTITG